MTSGARPCGSTTAPFHFRISTRELRLEPVISTAARRKALARPLQFSTAGWQVAVSCSPTRRETRELRRGWC
jgi:hypothetical protein